jgi:hypothetical protein
VRNTPLQVQRSWTGQAAGACSGLMLLLLLRLEAFGTAVLMVDYGRGPEREGGSVEPQAGAGAGTGAAPRSKGPHQTVRGAHAGRLRRVSDVSEQEMASRTRICWRYLCLQKLDKRTKEVRNEETQRCHVFARPKVQSTWAGTLPSPPPAAALQRCALVTRRPFCRQHSFWGMEWWGVECGEAKGSSMSTLLVPLGASRRRQGSSV